MQSGNVVDSIVNDLLLNPVVAASIFRYSYSWIDYGTHVNIEFSVKYKSESKCSVFLVRNYSDLEMAVSLMLRFHMSAVSIVCDNRKGFFPIEVNAFSALFTKLLESVGEEFQTSQYKNWNGFFSSMFENEMLIFEITFEYFDSSPKDVNDLLCVIAEDAIEIRKKCNNNIFLMLAEILYYFRRHFKYKNNGKTSDHSVVGMYKNRTGVCQAISVYAYLFFQFLGIKGRYVLGEANGIGGWESHAWNQVFMGGRWVHIDYTWQLNKQESFKIVSENELRKDHHWNEEQYAAPQSNFVVNSKYRLRHSTTRFYPKKPYFAINNCILDMSNIHMTSVVRNGTLYVLIDIIIIYGGCYKLAGNQIAIFIGVSKYSFPLEKVLIRNNAWYLPTVMLSKIGLKVEVDEKGAIIISNRNYY